MRRLFAVHKRTHGVYTHILRVQQHNSYLYRPNVLNIIQCRFLRGSSDPRTNLTTTLAKALAANKPDEALSAYKQYISEGHKYPPPIDSYRLILVHYAMGQYPNGENQDYPRAEKLFKDMESFNLTATPRIYEAMIMGAVDSGSMERVTYYYKHFLSKGVKPTTDLYNAILAGCVLHGSKEDLDKALADMKKLGVPHNDNTKILLESSEGRMHDKLKPIAEQMKIEGAKSKELLSRGAEEVRKNPNMSDTEFFKMFSEQILSDDTKKDVESRRKLEEEVNRLKEESAELRRKVEQLLQQK